MDKKITWETDFNVALSRANGESKHILIDFFNPGWIGCQQMDAVTYPETVVVDFIQKKIIPVRIPFDTQPYCIDFNIQWTPTLVTLDPDGKEHHRTTGFLSPEELIPSLMLGIAKCQFDLGQFTEAIATIDKLLKEHAKSDSAPEAIYYLGVSQYKNTNDPAPLKVAYERLKDECPNSEWTKRAHPYSLL